MVRRHGEHIVLAYNFLMGLGYTQKELEDKHIYTPLVFLSSPEARAKLVEFAESKRNELYNILCERGLDSLLYVFQTIVEEIGLPYHPLEGNEYEKAYQIALNKLGCLYVSG
ncbi:TPA: hypothetical protein ACGU4W_001108 [Vibrio vulnificus]|nr:hypothetical protein [Vibrio vulnificus]